MDGTILVADDDKTIRTVLTQALVRAGCKVHATSSLVTLMRWVEEGKGDLVITDVMMPDGNGLEQLPRISSLRPSLPVIVISAQSTIMTAIQATEADAYDYMPKPFDLPDLMKRAGKALEVKRKTTSEPEIQVEQSNDELPLVGRTPAMQTLYRLIARVMNADLPVLITGESGTGKTMAAEAIANELRLNLYRIDLSAVVSKYIGDREKNLCRLFDAAEDGGTILFFDEADSLFGKRSEVKDSHDRFANIGVNYLLQRMESFSGLAILATNMKRALDAAFMRRLRFIVDFSFPSAAQREAIWAKSFPKTTGSDLDFKWLARINLTGGGIHSVALNSAFASAAQGLGCATMPIVLKAAKAEMVKLDRHINESDFQWTEPVEAVA